MRLLRKGVQCVLLLLVLTLVGCGSDDSKDDTKVKDEGTGLKELADAAGVNVGTAVGGSFLVQEEYKSKLQKHFNHVTHENEMKWSVMRPTKDTFNWDGADKLINYAKANKMRVRGHTLVWHSQNPTWLNNFNGTREELLQILDDHMKAIVERYGADTFYAWDVVNEAFQDGSGEYRDGSESVWYKVVGEDYIAEAFKLARKNFPNSRLYYNDYNIERMRVRDEPNGTFVSVNNKAQSTYDLAKKLVEDDVPIDGVGFQMHQVMRNWFDVEDFTNNIQRFADLGLRVDITELDIRHFTPMSKDELEQQADHYSDVAKTYFSFSRDVADTFITWGIHDGQSWIPGHFSGEGEALMFDDNYNPKPAYFAVQKVLQDLIK